MNGSFCVSLLFYCCLLLLFFYSRVSIFFCLTNSTDFFYSIRCWSRVWIIVASHILRLECTSVFFIVYILFIHFFYIIILCQIVQIMVQACARRVWNVLQKKIHRADDVVFLLPFVLFRQDRFGQQTTQKKKTQHSI